MQKIEKIRERILTIIQREEIITQSEKEALFQKQQSNKCYYGIGGSYQRYEQAIERREKHLSELEALRKAQNSPVILEPLRLYGYFCPSCNEKIYLREKNPETMDCPLCSRRIYRDGVYTEWNVQKKSRFTCLRRHENEKNWRITEWLYIKSWICGLYRTG